MADLHVSIGADARTSLCEAFAAARRSIDAQFYSLADANVVDEINAAARRGVDVTIRVEGDRGRYGHAGAHEPIDAHTRQTFARYDELLDHRVHLAAEADPLILEHAKAVVVDDARAFIATANPNADGFAQPGEVLVEDDAPADVEAVKTAIGGFASQSSRIVAGPDASARARIAGLLDATVDEHIAIEDLSDPSIVGALIIRRQRGLHDAVLVKSESRVPSPWLRALAASDIALRVMPQTHLHDKYIDAGDRIYIGSANLTRNGLDEAREIGIIARPDDFDDGAASLRAEFDRLWAAASPIDRTPGPVG